MSFLSSFILLSCLVFSSKIQKQFLKKTSAISRKCIWESDTLVIKVWKDSERERKRNQDRKKWEWIDEINTKVLNEESESEKK